MKLFIVELSEFKRDVLNFYCNLYKIKYSELTKKQYDEIDTIIRYVFEFYCDVYNGKNLDLISMVTEFIINLNDVPRCSEKVIEIFAINLVGTLYNYIPNDVVINKGRVKLSIPLSLVTEGGLIFRLEGKNLKEIEVMELYIKWLKSREAHEDLILNVEKFISILKDDEDELQAITLRD